MKSVQGILEAETGIKLHIPTKSLSKMVIHNIELADDEIVPSILNKNSQIKSLIESGSTFELLFVQKIKDTNIRNAIIKVDSKIRDLIGSNGFIIFVWLKNCRVYDRIYHKTCYNCQQIGSHTISSCPTPQIKVCRFCAGSHESAQCNVKNDVSKYKCINCDSSDIINTNQVQNHISQVQGNARSCKICAI